MTLDSLVARGERVAFYGVDDRFEARLRIASGLRGPVIGPGPNPSRIAYCGHDFRSYPWMRIGAACALYAAIAPIDQALLAEYLALAGLERSHDTGRMKRAYQRAFVLALGVSQRPECVIVERGEEFDEARPAALLREAVARAPRAMVTFAGEVAAPASYARCVDVSPVVSR